MTHKCGKCSKCYSHQEWMSLAAPRQGEIWEVDEEGWLLMRDCVCGSTMAMEIPPQKKAA